MRRRFNLVALGLVAGSLLSTGCASTLGPVMIDGVATPRLNLEFIGQPYAIKHYNAYPRPGNPSGGLAADGGTIAGTVCGTDIQYQVTHFADHVRVSGFINNLYPVSLEIREANHIRRIQGGLANFSVDVLVVDDMLGGAVGRCRYEMHPTEDATDTFSQPLMTQGYGIHVRINGRKELSQMPAADQAALVPLMLYCSTSKVFENMGHDPPELGFGGELGAQPPNTIDFGPQRRVYCGGEKTINTHPR